MTGPDAKLRDKIPLASIRRKLLFRRG